jgi:hypothetical protein
LANDLGLCSKLIAFDCLKILVRDYLGPVLPGVGRFSNQSHRRTDARRLCDPKLTRNGILLYLV